MRLRILDHGVGVLVGLDDVLVVHGLDGTILTSLAVGDGSDTQLARVGPEPLAGLEGSVDIADSNGLLAVEEREFLTYKEAVSVAALVDLSELTGELVVVFLNGIIQETGEGNRVVSDLLGGSSGDESDSKELHILIIDYRFVLLISG